MDRLIAAHLIGRQELARRLGLSATDLTCFGFVLEAGDDLLTAGDLAARAHVTTGAVTGILNRLERAGYVARRPDPKDRRRVRVAALPDAATRVAGVHSGHYERLTELFADYTPAELATLTDWFTRATALAHDHLERLTRTDSPGKSNT